jgi:hypothetical protein
MASTITRFEHHLITLVTLVTRVRNIFPPPTSLKQLEDFLQEEWYKIPLQTAQNLYESIPRTVAVLKANINKEMCTVDVVFPLFRPTLLSMPSGSPLNQYIQAHVSTAYSPCLDSHRRQ